MSKQTMRKYPIRFMYSKTTPEGWKWIDSSPFGARAVLQWCYEVSGVKMWREVYALHRGDHIAIASACQQHKDLGIQVIP